MRKLPLFVLVALLLLTGCSQHHKEEQESIKNYESFIDAVLNNGGSVSKIIPFDYTFNVVKQKDNSYQYEVIISNPRVAMYNIQAIAVDPALDSNSNVYPCLGLLGDDATASFNMIPYQANGERGFVRKIYLDGVSSEDQFTLQVMVTWKDSSLVNTNRVFFTCNYTQEDGDTANGKKETADLGK